MSVVRVAVNDGVERGRRAMPQPEWWLLWRCGVGGWYAERFSLVL